MAKSTTTEQVQTGTAYEPTQTGARIEQVQTGTAYEHIQTGTTPEYYDVDLSRIDITPGSGMGETFTDLGGDPSKIAQAVEIASQFDAEYGMVHRWSLVFRNT